MQIESRAFEWRAFMLFLLVIGVLAVLVFLPYLDVIVLAAALAVLFEPIYRRLAYVFPRHTGIASFITVVLVFFVVITPLVYFGIQVVKEAGHLYASVSSLTESSGGTSEVLTGLHASLPAWLAPVIPSDPARVSAIAQAALGWFVDRLGGIFAALANVVLGFLLMLIAIYYILKDGKKFLDRLVLLSPLAKHHDQLIGEKIYATVNSVVKGTLFVAVIQGVVAGIGFFIFGVPNPALLGAATTVAALVPALGTFLTVAPVVIYLFAIGKMGAAVGLLLWGAFVVGLIDNFIRPHLIVRSGVNIHPFLILVSVLGGLHFFGPIGFITGPLVLSLFLALLDIYGTHMHPTGQAAP